MTLLTNILIFIIVIFMAIGLYTRYKIHRDYNRRHKITRKRMTRDEMDEIRRRIRTRAPWLRNR